jgi:ribosomal protein S18
VEDIHDLIESLGEELVGDQPPFIVGHSLGGLIATAYAARYPICGVVNVDQSLQVGPLPAEMAAAVRGEGFADFVRAVFASLHGELDPVLEAARCGVASRPSRPWRRSPGRSPSIPKADPAYRRNSRQLNRRPHQSPKFVRPGKRKRNPLTAQRAAEVAWKDIELLRTFISDRGKIRARRGIGLTPRQQKQVAVAIKNAREMALLPYLKPQRS